MFSCVFFNPQADRQADNITFTNPLLSKLAKNLITMTANKQSTHTETWLLWVCLMDRKQQQKVIITFTSSNFSSTSTTTSTIAVLANVFKLTPAWRKKEKLSNSDETERLILCVRFRRNGEGLGVWRLSQIN